MYVVNDGTSCCTNSTPKDVHVYVMITVRELGGRVLSSKLRCLFSGEDGFYVRIDKKEVRIKRMRFTGKAAGHDSYELKVIPAKK